MQTQGRTPRCAIDARIDWITRTTQIISRPHHLNPIRPNRTTGMAARIQSPPSLAGQGEVPQQRRLASAMAAVAAAVVALGCLAKPVQGQKMAAPNRCVRWL